MCNIYDPLSGDLIAVVFGRKAPKKSYKARIGPLQDGPFVTSSDETHVGQWGLIAPWSSSRVPKTSKGVRMSTNNARIEGVAKSPTFRNAWTRGKRCLIPAVSFTEPCWETGKNVWWRFSRTDGQPWALGGLWDEWQDRETGELVPSYTMLTQNADQHPLLNRMHRPGKEKRTLVPIEQGDWDTWLEGSESQVLDLVRLPSMNVIEGMPAND